eukprot:g11478.t1
MGTVSGAPGAGLTEGYGDGNHAPGAGLTEGDGNHARCSRCGSDRGRREPRAVLPVRVWPRDTETGTMRGAPSAGLTEGYGDGNRARCS